MINQTRLTWILNQLVARGLIHKGQMQDVLNRGREKARHILLDKRAEMRRLLGKQRVTYNVSEMELIASFRFKIEHDEGILTERLITKTVARALNMPFVEIDPLKLDFRLVTEAFGGPFAERHMVIALQDEPNVMVVAVADPWATEVLEQLAHFKQKPIRPVLAMKSALLSVIAEFHGFRRSMIAAEAEFRSDLPDLGNLEALYQVKGVNELDATDQPVVQAVWYLLNYAFEQRASDIHIEPKREESLVRMRIDGVLHAIHRLPKLVHPAVISRIKMLGRMDIAERRRPQDGRFKTRFRDKEVELRLSTVPTAFGEKAVIRIFDPGMLLQSLDNLGFFQRELMLFDRFIRNTAGLILVTGPTGSGKTTTLYSALNHIASSRINICTIEDPIEMVHEKFNQMAIHPKIGFDFPAALRTALRQDPDVIMVGEIRDPETAKNAVQAALTGHLVLSTIHTNDAASSITRLLDLGVYPFLVSSVLLGVIAQRLVRKVCPHCTKDSFLTEEQTLALGIPGAEGRRLRVKQSVGCVRCRGIGYRGRTGVYEVMPVTPRITRLINEQSPSMDIKREALNDGMLTLRECAIKKLGRGETTYDEVITITDETPVY